jgi:hypothetical protein
MSICYNILQYFSIRQKPASDAHFLRRADFREAVADVARRTNHKPIPRSAADIMVLFGYAFDQQAVFS